MNLNYFFIFALIFVIIVSGCTSPSPIVEDGGNDVMVKETRVLNPLNIFGENIEFLVYNIAGNPTGSGFVSIPFLLDSDEHWVVNVVADFDESGDFESFAVDENFQEEWIVKNADARVFKDYNNRFTFNIIDPKINDKTEIKARVILSTHKLTDLMHADSDTGIREVTANVLKLSGDESLGIGVPGASEELKRGGVIFMEGENGSSSNLPDLTGGPMDCFAIATANNLISMAERNGVRDQLPANPQDLISELKNDMQWNNGIIKANFLTGKAAFVERLGLPIVTEEIKRPSLDDIRNALNSGKSVEISTAMTRSASGMASTGHVLTGVGVGANGQLSVHDPATPQGADNLGTSMSGGDSPFILVEYPMWDGIMFVDAIYTQTWIGSQPAVAVGTPGTALGEGKVEVDVIGIGGKYYPVFQFFTENSPEDVCGVLHWHSNARVYAIDDAVGITDPGPPCGYGKVSEVPRMTMEITEAQASAFVGGILGS